MFVRGEGWREGGWKVYDLAYLCVEAYYLPKKYAFKKTALIRYRIFVANTCFEVTILESRGVVSVSVVHPTECTQIIVENQYVKCYL